MNQENTGINSSNSGPLSADRNELSPLHGCKQDNKGLRGIIVCFTVFTAIISVFLALQLEYGDYQIVPHGSVTSDSKDCSAAGVAIMKKGGNSVDALVATSFCLGVVQPHLTGLGSGGFLLVYDQRQRSLIGCYDFRASAVMNSSTGVPGFVAGLYKAHEEHGILPWPALLVPAIEIARAGFVASESLLTAKSLVLGNTSVSEWISSWQQSTLITNPQLADTLEVIANEGADAFYKGRLTIQLENYFPASDLSNYEVLSGSCLKLFYKEFNVIVPGPGSGGPLLLQTLGLLNQTILEEASLLSVALAMRDVREVNWTFSAGSHVGAMDHNDLYASVVSGLGSVFGSQSKTSGGYVLNNAVDLSPVGSDNRPTSLATPVIAVDFRQVCGQRNILGGGDARDVAQVLALLLDWRSPANQTLNDIVDEPRARITRQEIFLEESHVPNVDPVEKRLLSSQYNISTAPLPYPSVNVIHKYGDVITSVSDSRSGEEAAIVF